VKPGGAADGVAGPGSVEGVLEQALVHDVGGVRLLEQRDFLRPQGNLRNARLRQFAWAADGHVAVGLVTGVIGGEVLVDVEAADAAGDDRKEDQQDVLPDDAHHVGGGEAAT